MKRNRISLDDLQQEINDDSKIELTQDTSIKASKIIIIKRDGREEPYDIKKMYKVVLWACDGDKYLTNELLESTEIKLYNKIKITDVYEELIKTAASKISLLYPQWEYIAGKLYLLQLYKDTWHINNGYYPELKDVIEKGLQHGMYNKDVFTSYTDEEIEEIDSHINVDKDLLFTYKGLFTFYDKYCMNYSKTKKLELPQHVYIRLAMFNHWKEPVDRIKKVIESYNYLSNHDFTAGTPITMNSGTNNPQLSSCVLNAMDDDTNSIMDTTKNLGVYSKFKGGTALDVSALRARGSYITGNQGNSSGAVPFIQIVEKTMKAFNQGGKRPGSCCVYFQWWHIDFPDLIVLKSNGGTEESRARGLKYAVKINDLLLDRWVNDEDISLFDPKDTPDLLGICGDEFNQKYVEYENKVSLKRKTVKARDLMYSIMKERSETGNIYLFHEENVNNHNMVNRYINTSNLCTEIMEPSRPSKLIDEELLVRESGERQIRKKYKAGEIALCNLSSVNLMNYYYLTDNAKDKLIKNIVTFMDNTIDIAKYPVKEGMNSNQLYRYLGIGVSNFTNLLASEKIVIDTQEALEFTHKLFDDLSYRIINASHELAMERGAFVKFNETNWALGILPVHMANKKAMKLTEYQPDMKKWRELARRIKKHGVRNALLMAIAPTATSGKAINATESILPVVNYLYKEDGTTSVATLAPNFRKNNQYYKKAFDCDQMKLVELAAIRQMYLDQAQSIDLYFQRPDSYNELMRVHLYAFRLGVKSLYYLKQNKSGADEVCESCT
jgi:ribonucleoside-diphosphate reductase alpha chain